MAWSNPSTVITKFRDQLLACTSLGATGLNTTTANYHYPKCAFQGDSPNALPAIRLAETEQNRERYCEGAVGLVGGTLVATFYLDATSTVDVGYTETLARTIVKELFSQFTGIAFRKMDVALSSDLTPGQRAADEDTPYSAYYSITLTVQYGLSRN
jgi:hypothetical protein